MPPSPRQPPICSKAPWNKHANPEAGQYSGYQTSDGDEEEARFIHDKISTGKTGKVGLQSPTKKSRKSKFSTQENPSITPVTWNPE